MARPRSSPLPWLVAVLFVGGLLIAGFVLGDGWAKERVERLVAEQLQVSLATPDQPQVTIQGFPFLVQVATRDVRSVRVSADQLGAGAEAVLPIAHAELVLSDITSPDWYKTMTASHIEGVALVTYAELERLARVPITYVNDGRVEIQVTAQVLGVDVNAKITGKPRLEPGEQAMTLADPSIVVADVSLPNLTAQALLRALLKPIPLEGVPLGLQLSALNAEQDGLHLAVNGDNVVLRS
jgi:CheY-like chemotaxis protein